MRFLLLLIVLLPLPILAQQKLPPDLMLRDFDLLREGLEELHTGLYLFTPASRWDSLFTTTRKKLSQDSLSQMAFYQEIAPLVAAAREDHTNISLPKGLLNRIVQQEKLFPLLLRFSAGNWYVSSDRSGKAENLYGKILETINGIPIQEVAAEMGKLFPSDGYITRVKWSDLEDFNFAIFHFIRYGTPAGYTLGFRDVETTVFLEPLTRITIKNNRREDDPPPPPALPNYEYRQTNDTLAYLGAHTFGLWGGIPFFSPKARYRRFLKKTFRDVKKQGITTLVIDLSQNGGGNEGVENMTYAYLGENYEKYKAVRLKSPRVDLDNGYEQIRKKVVKNRRVKVVYEQLANGTYQRRPEKSYGLRAFRRAPKDVFRGQVYVLIGPYTYSGGSELASMLRTNTDAIFLGEETGGAYHGNTSGYGFTLTLPHSGIRISIPLLHFDMNVKGGTYGRGIMPDVLLEPGLEAKGRYDKIGLRYLLGE